MANTDSKVNPIEFFKQVRQETLKVTWPGRKEVLFTSFMVLIFALILAVFFVFVDSIIDFILSHILF